MEFKCTLSYLNFSITRWAIYTTYTKQVEGNKKVQAVTNGYCHIHRSKEILVVRVFKQAILSILELNAQGIDKENKTI